jgi:hypothetical protein
VVTLAINRDFGDITHEAAVTTDAPAAQPIVLRTIATAHPPLRIEETSAQSSQRLVEGAPAGTIELLVTATGTASEPPADLNRLDLAGSVPAHWLGEQSDIVTDGILATRTRRLAATLESNAPTGQRAGSVILQQSGASLLEYPVHWEVVAPIVATPRTIVAGKGRQTPRLILTSADDTTFNVLSIHFDNQLLAFEDSPSQNGRIHALRLTIDPATQRDDQSKSSVTIQLNHPALQMINIPIVWLDTDAGIHP